MSVLRDVMRATSASPPTNRSTRKVAFRCAPFGNHIRFLRSVDFLYVSLRRATPSAGSVVVGNPYLFELFVREYERYVYRRFVVRRRNRMQIRFRMRRIELQLGRVVTSGGA